MPHEREAHHFYGRLREAGKARSLASTRERDRSFLLNEAFDQYLDLNDYHICLIEQGIGDVAAGRVSSLEEVRRALAEQTLEWERSPKVFRPKKGKLWTSR